MKYLIAGLGNIGEEYQDTRHNIGFSILDALAKVSSLAFISGRYAHSCELSVKGRKLILIKPTTYMNLSGKAINYWLQKENMPVENMLVILDDLSLPFGKIRLRDKGSDAGHNGLKNIQEALGHNNYSRLRFGVGNEFPRGGQVDFVLSKFNNDECKQMPDRINLAIDAVKIFALMGITAAMNQFNNK